MNKVTNNNTLRGQALHGQSLSGQLLRNPARGGLPVRTNLRAGLAWDDLDDQATALWNKLSSAVSNAAGTLTATTGGDASKPAA